MSDQQRPPESPPPDAGATNPSPEVPPAATAAGGVPVRTIGAVGAGAGGLGLSAVLISAWGWAGLLPPVGAIAAWLVIRSHKAKQKRQEQEKASAKPSAGKDGSKPSTRVPGDGKPKASGSKPAAKPGAGSSSRPAASRPSAQSRPGPTVRRLADRIKAARPGRTAGTGRTTGAGRPGGRTPDRTAGRTGAPGRLAGRGRTPGGTQRSTSPSNRPGRLAGRTTGPATGRTSAGRTNGGRTAPTRRTATAGRTTGPGRTRRTAGHAAATRSAGLTRPTGRAGRTGRTTSPTRTAGRTASPRTTGTRHAARSGGTRPTRSPSAARSGSGRTSPRSAGRTPVAGRPKSSGRPSVHSTHGGGRPRKDKAKDTLAREWARARMEERRERRQQRRDDKYDQRLADEEYWAALDEQYDRDRTEAYEEDRRRAAEKGEKPDKKPKKHTLPDGTEIEIDAPWRDGKPVPGQDQSGASGKPGKAPYRRVWDRVFAPMAAALREPFEGLPDPRQSIRRGAVAAADAAREGIAGLRATTRPFVPTSSPVPTEETVPSGTGLPRPPSVVPRRPTSPVRVDQLRQPTRPEPITTTSGTDTPSVPNRPATGGPHMSNFSNSVEAITADLHAFSSDDRLDEMDATNVIEGMDELKDWLEAVAQQFQSFADRFDGASTPFGDLFSNTLGGLSDTIRGGQDVVDEAVAGLRQSNAELMAHHEGETGPRGHMLNRRRY